MVMQHLFSVNKSEHTEKESEKESEIAQEEEGESERVRGWLLVGIPEA